ncbi:MAG: hypothetical protein IKQ91_11435 [Oscillospiraceae bacterium]|nr:hypothetical protein [Oscillospiraceae bacterium]
MNRLLRRIAALFSAWLLTAALFSGVRPMLTASAAAEIYGIDISKFQETIDWKTVRENDIRFAILRCCKVIRAYDDWEADSTFEENYTAARAAGLAVGCYMFTDAATKEEFESDVKYMLGFLKDKSFDFPVFLDLESASRQEHLPPEVFMPALLSALEMIEDAGHTAGVYSSSAFFSECIDRRQLQEAGYAIWEANYFNTVNGLASPEGYDLSAEASIWQYSGNGRVPGIKTTVDRNLCYTNEYFNRTAAMVNSVLPNGIMKTGTNFTIAGTISSAAVIRTITGAIYDTQNPAEPVQTVTVYPHARDYKLTGFFTKKLVFSTLEEGDYELRITAVDASDTTISVASSQFRVSNSETPTVSEQPVNIDPDAADGEEAVPAMSPADLPHEKKGTAGLRFAAWFYKNWSVRKMSGTATRLCLKLKLERTPFFRIVSSVFYDTEACYLAASLCSQKDR